MKCFMKALAVLQSNKYVTVYSHFIYESSNKKAWLQTAYFKSDLYVDVHISAIFAVWIDFTFVAGFSAFPLKIRNSEFFIMIWYYLDMQRVAYIEDTQASWHHAIIVWVLFWRKHICIFVMHIRKRTYLQKKKKKEHRKQHQLSKTKNLSMSYKEEVSKCFNCRIIWLIIKILYSGIDIYAMCDLVNRVQLELQHICVVFAIP